MWAKMWACGQKRGQLMPIDVPTHSVENNSLVQLFGAISRQQEEK